MFVNIKASVSKEEITDLLIDLSEYAKKYKFDKKEFVEALYDAITESQVFAYFVAKALEKAILQKYDSIKEADDALDILRITSAVEKLKQLEEQSKEKEQ
jgi:hypothetical protein